MRLHILLGTLVVATSIAVLHQLALEHFLYWKLWWFDVLLHFLGGVLIGGIAFVFSDVYKTPRLLTLILILLIVGIGWEVFEWIFKLYDGAWDPVDTAIDLAMDTLGAFLVYSGIKVWK